MEIAEKTTQGNFGVEFKIDLIVWKSVQSII